MRERERERLFDFVQSSGAISRALSDPCNFVYLRNYYEAKCIYV